MADNVEQEKAIDKEQKEEENEKIKTANQENDTKKEKDLNKDKDKDQDKLAPILEEKKEQETSDNAPSKEQEDKNITNNSHATAEQSAEVDKNVSNNSDKPVEQSAGDTVNTDKPTKVEDVKKGTTAEKTEKTDAPVEKSKVVKVDLKAVQTHYKTHTKTTLPHVLTEYGFEDKSFPKQKTKEKTKKTKKKVEIIDTIDDEERHNRRVREEKFRQMFGDNRNVDKYYMEYLEFIQEKVMKQRQQAQKQKEEEERLAAFRAEEEPFEEWEQKPVIVEKPQSVDPQDQRNKTHNNLDVEEQLTDNNILHRRRHTLTRRLQRMELTHDVSFLKDLPKTDLARIVKLQDKMKKEGKLKTQTDVDKFWTDIRNPDVFYAQFKVKRTFDPGPSLLTEPTTPKPDFNPRSLSHISESSRDEKEPWAITQKYQSVHGQKTPTGEKPRKDSTQLAKEAALDLERRCPKLEMPPLACFSLKLGEKPPDPADVQKKIELKAREKSRKKYQRKLQKMYQMAMTNSAASNRILAQHGDLTAIMDGGTLRDVRNFCCEPQQLAVFDEPYTLEQHYRDMTDPSRQVDQLPDHISEASHGSQGSRQSSAGSRVRLTPISQTSSRPGSLSKRKKKAPEMIEAPPESVPLSFDQVFSREKTIEAKCLSTYWSNYMQAGKSVFAPT